MTTVEVRPGRLLPPEPSAHAEVAWWGMALFCVTEGALFAYFLASYFYLGVGNPSWPPAGIERPKLLLPLIMTALLLTSSVTLYLADKAHERGDVGRHRVGTLLTIALGVAFLALQAKEYADKAKHFTPPQHAYASIFYTITGFHGTHVAVGLLFLAWALLRSSLGREGATPLTRPMGVKATSLYWHFVDGVWLVILTSLYLSPHWY